MIIMKSICKTLNTKKPWFTCKTINIYDKLCYERKRKRNSSIPYYKFYNLRLKVYSSKLFLFSPYLPYHVFSCLIFNPARGMRILIQMRLRCSRYLYPRIRNIAGKKNYFRDQDQCCGYILYTLNLDPDLEFWTNLAPDLGFCYQYWKKLLIIICKNNK